MVKFSIKRKGYSIDEVDGFVAKLLELTEEKLRAQAERIDELKTELRRVTAEKSELKAREASVTMALAEAVRRADELQSASEVRYSVELNRIKAIRKRLHDYTRQNPTIDTSEFDEFLTDMTIELQEGIKSLGVEETLVPVEEVKEEVAFDIQEALTPKETLEEICKELGLIE